MARSRHRPGTVQEPRVSELWSQAWPFGMVAVLYPVFFQVSTILLKYLGGDTQAGFWAIGLAVMTAIYLIPATIYQKFLLSKLHRWAAHDPAEVLDGLPARQHRHVRCSASLVSICARRGVAVRGSAGVRRGLSRRHRDPDGPGLVSADPLPVHGDGLGAAHRQAHALPGLRDGMGDGGGDSAERRLDSDVRRERRRLGDGRRRTGAVGGHLARRARFRRAKGAHP